MKRKLKTFTPFSNETEAMFWMDRNCDLCKYIHCWAKTTIERGFITGTIPLKRAEWIGYNKLGLNDKCEHFTTVSTSIPKDRDNIDKFHYKMF